MSMKRKKMSGSIFECTKCSHSGTRGHMLEHFIRRHVSTEQVPWSCSLCGYRSNSRKELSAHSRHYMHKAAEKKNPGAPITFVKSKNPYVVRIGQDILSCTGPVVRESYGESDREDFSPNKKRRQDEYKANKRKIRVTRYLDSRQYERDNGRRHCSDGGRCRPSRFEDYDIEERPDRPVYDLQEEEEEVENDHCCDERDYVQFPSFRNGHYEETLSGSDSGRYRETSESDRDVDMSKDLVYLDRDKLFQRDNCLDGEVNGDMAPGGFGSDSTSKVWMDWSAEPVYSQYGAINVRNREHKTFQQRMILNSALADYTSSFGGNNALADYTSAFGESTPVDSTRSRAPDAQFPSGHQSSVESGYVMTSLQTAYHTGSSARMGNGNNVPLSLNLERVPASSSTPGKSELQVIAISESSSNGQDRCPTETRKEIEPDRHCVASSDCSVGKIRRSSRHGSADQSAEVGSTCREKDKPDLKQGPENTATPCKQPVPERPASACEANTLPVRKELEHPEQETHTGHQEGGECPKDGSEDEYDSQLLEEKMTELISALEPLKNISKALIALDHHMRKLLPVMEQLTKDLPTLKTQKHQ